MNRSAIRVEVARHDDADILFTPMRWPPRPRPGHRVDEVDGPAIVDRNVCVSAQPLRIAGPP